MSNENADLIWRAYEAYANGDLAAMLEFVDPDLEWTYLDPALEHPTPQVCHGRHEFEQVLRHWAEHGVRAELDEVASGGELVMVGVRTPGVGADHGRLGDDRVYSVCHGARWTDRCLARLPRSGGGPTVSGHPVVSSCVELALGAR